MLIIPGKYLDKDGNEYNLILTASDGISGEKTVVYRRSSGGSYFTLPASTWKKRFTSVEEAAFEQYCKEPDISDVEQRFFELFYGREDVYSVHWHSTFGTDGYNYACSGEKFADGCMKGTDNCKNCRSGRLERYNLITVQKHLNGEITAGVYPVTSDGNCKFMAITTETRAKNDAVLSVCNDLDIPAYSEIFKGGLRLWFFFSSPVPAKYAAVFGNSLITAAMERSSEVNFDLYETVVPPYASVVQGSFGKPIVLPLGKSRHYSSVFVDKELNPLPMGEGEIINFRTITKSYLVDRITALGSVNYGQLYTGVRQKLVPIKFPAKVNIEINQMITINKNAFSSKTLSVLRRMCSFKTADVPESEFEPSIPPIEVCYVEDGKTISLPRGVWQDLEEILKISSADYKISQKRTEGKSISLRLSAEIGEEASAAASELMSRNEGIVLGETGSGKTFVVLKIIYELKTNALILTSDEYTSKRWADNIYRHFGIDVSKSNGKIDVRCITDEKIRDKYGLVILADCSRLPMSRDIYLRLRKLAPMYIYGITADDKRRDKLWNYIHMLCGDVVFRMTGR